MTRAVAHVLYPKEQPEWAVACPFCNAAAGKPCRNVPPEEVEPYCRGIHMTRRSAFVMGRER